MKKEWIYITLVALVLISPWPIIALTSQPEKYAYVVAVPSDGTALTAPVSPIFARSAGFFIVNLKDSTFRLIKNRFQNEQHAVGLRIAHLLIDERVGAALVRGHIGPESYNNLVARHVRVFGLQDNPQAPISVQEAVTLYARSALPELTAPTVPTHFGL